MINCVCISYNCINFKLKLCKLQTPVCNCVEMLLWDERSVEDKERAINDNSTTNDNVIDFSIIVVIITTISVFGEKTVTFSKQFEGILIQQSAFCMLHMNIPYIAFASHENISWQNCANTTSRTCISDHKLHIWYVVDLKGLMVHSGCSGQLSRPVTTPRSIMARTSHL